MEIYSTLDNETLVISDLTCHLEKEALFVRRYYTSGPPSFRNSKYHCIDIYPITTLQQKLGIHRIHDRKEIKTFIPGCFRRIAVLALLKM